MKYQAYIVTYAGTEIETRFKTKKEALDYLKDELFVRDEMESLCVLLFKLDKEGDKLEVNTKYSFDNRW